MLQIFNTQKYAMTMMFYRYCKRAEKVFVWNIREDKRRVRDREKKGKGYESA